MKKAVGVATCEVCEQLRSGVRICEKLDPVSWRGTRVRACQPCRAKHKLTPIDFSRPRVASWV